MSRPRAAGRAAGLLAGLLTIALAAGCGVPGSSRPVKRGDAPQLNVTDQTRVEDPPGPDTASSPSVLLQRYLQQAAWANARSADRPDVLNHAVSRVRRYLIGGAAATWQPGGGGLTLARVRLGTPVEVAGEVGAFTIDTMIEPVGVLGENGAVDPPGSAAPYPFQFKVVGAGAGQLRLERVPPGLLLNVDDLDAWYDRRMIYFWSDQGAQRVLVPDRRYLAKVVTPEKRYGDVFKWLRDGPSTLLEQVVQRLPEVINLKERIVPGVPGRPLRINLSGEAAGPSREQLQDLLTQIRWSLHPETTPVQLEVADQNLDLDGSSNAYLSRNPAAWPDGMMEPDKFCVLDGQARPVDGVGARASPLLGDQTNRDVISAAATGVGDAQVVALVRGEPAGHRLWLGAVAGSGDTRGPRFRQTEVAGRELSRPTWVGRRERHLLLAVDGKLIMVGSDGTAKPVTVAMDLGPVTAVSVAPDGRRAALVAGGQAYVAAIRLDGDGLTVGPAYRQLVTGLAATVGVGWTREDGILVGGTAHQGGSPMVEVSLDGTRRNPIERTNLADLKITQLVAYPDNPVVPGERVLAMFEANGQAYDVYGQGVGLIQPAESAPSPTPSASPNTIGAPRPAVVRAPFFRE